MCIRDSIKAGQGNTGHATTGILMDTYAHTQDTVSYTHLDVYKRQTMSRGFAFSHVLLCKIFNVHCGSSLRVHSDFSFQPYSTSCENDKCPLRDGEGYVMRHAAFARCV